MKDKRMILILYLYSSPDIGCPTESSLKFMVFQSGRPFLASGHGRLMLVPWSLLATQSCTAVNWSPQTFDQQHGGYSDMLLCSVFCCHTQRFVLFCTVLC